MVRLMVGNDSVGMESGRIRIGLGHMLVPATNRPYIGGSQTNSLWNLIWGYNGFGRLTGSETATTMTNTQVALLALWPMTGVIGTTIPDLGPQHKNLTLASPVVGPACSSTA